MRGDLVSRPIGEVMKEAEGLVRAGVRELLVISQDTSAYGVDIKYQHRFLGRAAAEVRLAGPGRERSRNSGFGCASTTSTLTPRRQTHSADG